MRSDRLYGRARWSYAALLSGALIFIVAAGCSIKRPSAPSWEVEYNLPLFNQWLDITDFMDDEDFIPSGGDTVYAIDFEETLDKIEIGDEITLDDLSESISQSIGTFRVPAGSPQSTSISLQQLGGPGDSGGATWPVPALSFTGVKKDLPVLGSFTQVVIDTGTVTVEVTNNTRVDFDTLGVRLLNEGAGDTLIVALDVTATGTLVDGETRTVVNAMDGLSVGNDLTVEILGHSVAGSAVLDGTEGIDIEVTVGELRVSSATAEVGEIDFDFFPTIPITDATKVESAVLSAGNLSLTLDNQLPIPLELSIELPSITDFAGSPVQMNLNPSEYSQDVDSSDLADHTISPADDGSGGKEFDLTVNVYSVGSGGGLVTLSSTDMVTVQADITGMVIRSITGVLDSTTVALPDSSFELDLGSGNLLEELRKVNLTAVELELTVRHNIDFPSHIELNLVGEGGDPDPVSVDIAFDLQQSGIVPTGPGDTTSVTDVYKMDELNSSLLDFLNAFPTTIRYSGSVIVGGGSDPGSLSSYSWVEAGVRFSTPLILDITEQMTIELDKEYNEEGIEMDEGSVEIQEATLTYSISSTMGLSMNVSLMVAADSALVYTDPDVELVLAIRGGGEAAQDTVVTLTKDQWELLSEPSYTGVRIDILPSAGTEFRIAKNDRLFTKAFVTVKAILNPEDNGGGGGR